ncbi:MAG: DUF2723 domain-containing protein [Gemmatimonadaceae bacterium]|jgi:hypothetical protein|nr:DUF2723 domain-containing protein [Gemmatimonadaceae bacterium]
MTAPVDAHRAAGIGARRPRLVLPRPSPSMTAAIVAAAVLFAVYAVTAAPDLTFWDAPELVTAIDGLGIPHPPGTPLYVLVARALRALFSAAGPPRAATMTSVTFAALTGGATAWLVTRWLGAVVPGMAAALMAGTTFSIWRNATETEVYAAALLLAMMLLVVAEHARAAARESRDAAPAIGLLAYLMGLAVPLHSSALVAAPAAVALAWPAMRAAWERRTPIARAPLAAVSLALGALGVSALAILPLRAQHEPILNEGNARSFAAWMDVVQRTQYAVPGLWPRRAPWWLQLGNVFEWADWQFARSLGPAPVPTVARTTASIIAAILAVVGTRVMWRRDRQAARALLVALVCGTVGVAVWLNLQLGPSYGAGVVPDGTPHEARERDYFFVLGWWAWGALAATGAWALAQRVAARVRSLVGHRVLAAVTIACAALPAVLNATAVRRTREPEATLPRALGLALLDATPPNAVLLLAGDLDGFPVWYLQAVEKRRLDVTAVIVPLLGAPWYRDELARRARLVIDWRARDGVSRAAARQRRALVASPLLAADQRGPGQWSFTGLLFVRGAGVPVDRGLVEQQAARVAPSLLDSLGPSADPAARLAQGALGCAPALSRWWGVPGREAATADVSLLERVCQLP